tara:strand:- start:1742 stop:2416 length:675 start_codon:yes stop_codon:yes gene_type:complete
MNIRLIVITLLSFFSILGFGQSRLKYQEYGFGIGSLTSSNEIATTSNVGSVLLELRPQARLYAMYHPNDWFGFGAELNYGWIYGEDVNHSNVNRGLEYYSTISQTNVFLEFDLIRYGKFHRETKFGLFVKLGGGFLSYNPNITFKNLQPENVEVYPDSYNSFNYYFSGGFKFRTGYKSSLRLEAYLHNSGVDNLEGFEYDSGFVNSSSNDLYGGIMLSYSILVF